MSCYRMNTLYFDKGMFDEYIDMVYILTMENSIRESEYLYQLNTYKPLSKVIIQYNKGFKLCSKKLYRQKPWADLNDSYLHVFLHAQKNNYSNILIFEDDFFFDNSMNQDSYKKHVTRIGKFITNNKYHVYNLAPLYHISIPSIIHIKCIKYGSSHACIYSKLYIEWFIKNYNNFNNSCDITWNNINIIKYKYYKCLCFQTHPITDNILSIDSDDQPGFRKTQIIVKLYVYFINKLKLYNKENAKNFYNTNNINFYIISYSLLFFLVFIIYYLYSIIIVNIK